jgi:phosphotransferase system HPr-like phosphotransfer protein
MYVRNRNIIIVCEGASEKAYIQELKRYLEEEDIALHFIPRCT